MDIIGLIVGDSNLCYQAAVLQVLMHNLHMREILEAHHPPSSAIQSLKLGKGSDIEHSCGSCCATGATCGLCAVSLLYRQYKDHNGEAYLECCQRLMSHIGSVFLASTQQYEHQDVAEFYDAFSNQVLSSTQVQNHMARHAFGQHQISRYNFCLFPQCSRQPRKRLEDGCALDCQVKFGIDQFDKFRDLPLQSLIHYVLNANSIDVLCPDLNCSGSIDRLYGPTRGAQITFISELSDTFVIRPHAIEEIDTGWMEKLGWPLIIPSELDFQDYVDPTSSSITAAETKYNLSAVICHRGSTDQGHYKVVVRDAEGKWIQADDDKISLLACRTRRDREFEAANGYPPAAEAAWSLDAFTPRMIFYTRQKASRE